MGTRVLISRTDSIGDVILTLPILGIIKSYWPKARITFLGNAYTKAVIESCEHVEKFIDVNDLTLEELIIGKFDHVIHVFPNKKVAKLCKEAGIKSRIGTSHRLFHWFTCNKLVNLSRKSSDFHEAQLNIKLLSPLKFKTNFQISELADYYGWKNSREMRDKISNDKFNLIFHMKSKGSAAEWPVKQFMELANKLDVNKYKIYITGTEAEGELIKAECKDILDLPHVEVVTGKFNLNEFISFVSAVDGLLACSTGPLHIAAASGIHALGLYPNVRPMHAGRWAPIGAKAQTISAEIMEVSQKRYLDVSPEAVLERIKSWTKN